MTKHSPLWEVVEPSLVRAGLYTVPDPTYGRWLLPPHPPHRVLIDDQAVQRSYRRVFLPPYSHFKTPQEAYDTTQITYSEDVELTPQELESGVRRGGRWVFYSTWEMKEEPRGGWEGGGKGRGRDIVLVHDLPSYGRSTGNGREQRKVFLCGASMGGWTVCVPRVRRSADIDRLYYLLKYPPTGRPADVVLKASDPDKSLPADGSGQGYDNHERLRSQEKVRIHVAGAFVLCPMVEVSKNSRPSIVVEYIGRALSYFAGSLPLAKAVRGNVSDDPRVEADFDSDLHGNKDRATSHHGTLKLFDRLPHEDKEIEIYDGYEHGE
ncbi:hypothetical protein IAU60_002217 [Kwoniella sp. DSM 27419]